jgi:hypothetical protein
MYIYALKMKWTSLVIPGKKGREKEKIIARPTLLK